MHIKTVQALNRLRAFKWSNTVWDKVPYTRRAGVLALLYQNRSGELSTILTLRSPFLTSFSGQVALPGGKADTATENVFEVARREAFEEIHLPQSDKEVGSRGFDLEYLTALPCYLSRNLLVVRPVVALLTEKEENSFQLYNEKADLPRIIDCYTDPHQDHLKEVHHVFSVPLSKFLDNSPDWYSGKLVDWTGLKWNQHSFRAIRRQKTIGEPGWLSVWGMTANILVDCARIAYDQEPRMEHRRKGKYGDEDLIQGLIDKGVLGEHIDKEEDVKIRLQDVLGKDSPLLKERMAHEP